MRNKLEPHLGNRVKLSAVVVRTCVCKREDYALIRNVRDDQGEYLADHAWVKLTNELNRQPLGAEITFTATVGKYQKNCGDVDFNLENLLLLY